MLDKESPQKQWFEYYALRSTGASSVLMFLRCDENGNNGAHRKAVWRDVAVIADSIDAERLLQVLEAGAQALERGWIT